MDSKLDVIPAPLVFVRRVDPAQVRLEAQQLAQLSASVQAEIAQAEKGALPKDLKNHLKQIEKLSKRLRGELNL